MSIMNSFLSLSAVLMTGIPIRHIRLLLLPSSDLKNINLYLINRSLYLTISLETIKKALVVCKSAKI